MTKKNRLTPVLFLSVGADDSVRPFAKYLYRPQCCGAGQRGDVGIAPYERTGERVRITDVGDGVLDVPHTATTKRPAFAGLLVYII